MKSWQAGRHEMALAGVRGAISLVDEKQAPRKLADLLECAATFYHASSDLGAAIEAIEQAIALARQQDDQRRLANYSLNLSAFCLSAGQLAEGLRAANESFTAAKKSDNAPVVVKALGNLGIISQRLGQLSNAELYLRRQHELALDLKDVEQTANAANALGGLFLAMGLMDSAAQALEEARRLAEKHGLADLEVSALNNLAIFAARATNRDRDKEEALYRKAIARSIEIDDVEKHYDAAVNLTRLLIDKRDYAEANTILKSLEDLAGYLQDPGRTASVTRLRGELALSKGRLEEAREEFQSAAHSFKESEPERAADCFVEAASIGYQQWQKAATNWTQAASDAALEAIFRDLVLALGIYEAIASKLDDYKLWLLMQRQEKGFRLYLDLVLNLSDPTKALEVVERGRGRALRFAMHRRRAGHRTRAFDYTQAIRDAAFRAVTEAAGKGGNFSQLSAAAFQALRRSVQRKEPEHPEIGERELYAIAKSLAAPVVEFAFGIDWDLYVWVLTENAVQFAKLDLAGIGGVDGLRGIVTQFHTAVGVTRDLGVGVAAAKGDPSVWLLKLYQLLIAPIEKWLPERQGAPLCIVPAGVLFEVPFAALQGADGRAVLDRWAVFEVPALHFFAVAPEEPGTGVVVAGDPAAAPAAEKEWGSIAPLPFARAEAQEVARLYGVTALVGAQATKKQLESMLSGAQVIHLAAHAILSSDRPFESAILLAATSEDDGLIRVRDIDAKTLLARLVVLSCCSTAGGAVTGDGVLSLCRGLLAAGAHSVLASLWAVADESTSFTMIDFHRRLVENPFQSKLAEIFRQSQLATRAKYHSHAQWAPFVLWGRPHWLQDAEWSKPMDQSPEKVDQAKVG